MMYKFSRILVLSPHTDDGEIGAGAFINKLIQSGAEVKYIAFSSCKESLRDGFEPDTLVKECQLATATLGISNIEILDYPVRKFNEHRQSILEKLIKVRAKFQPDLVIVPSSSDIHQDHSVIFNEGQRAFKNTTLIGYFFPWNCINFSADLVVEVSADDVKAKENSIACYKSQSHRFYAQEGYMRNMCQQQGSNTGLGFSEVYEVIRWVIKNESA
ncbi:PIG-L family deacetylase [Shewanella olleyana]|uniref:PIG-L deacetylase family protein n=1 Tax=Shewanella olleyana TaxID=135626 RepID=UPI00200FE2CD|nr:PIG-L deacetylase family protein [Shewanella olleyana]MCL1067039.1 PIG-L family deacetylase [Shewanella olleyana]